MNLALFHVESVPPYPLTVDQVVRKAVKATTPKTAPEGAEFNTGAAEKGSRNKNRTEVELSPFQTQLQTNIREAVNMSSRPSSRLISSTMEPRETMQACKSSVRSDCV